MAQQEASRFQEGRQEEERRQQEGQEEERRQEEGKEEEGEEVPRCEESPPRLNAFPRFLFMISTPLLVI